MELFQKFVFINIQKQLSHCHSTVIIWQYRVLVDSLFEKRNNETYHFAAFCDNSGFSGMYYSEIKSFCIYIVFKTII